MYVRPPERQRPQVKLPENYSGNAFRQGNPYNSMPPPARPDLPPRERRERDRMDHLPPDPYPEEAAFEEDAEPIETPLPLPAYPHTEEDAPSEQSAPEAAAGREAPTSLLSLLPGLSGRFPFGHGLGSEELLILAVMLMITMSEDRREEDDRILLLMLGLLLFAG